VPNDTYSSWDCTPRQLGSGQKKLALARIWISQGGGLPLRQEFDLDAGAGNKKHHSSRYEYTNVQPPPL
jgi:hypothetical protein